MRHAYIMLFLYVVAFTMGLFLGREHPWYYLQSGLCLGAIVFRLAVMDGRP